ncbi:hypothetical protein BDB01DRAFT_724213 [Pilobolus umbonatus]|nr:hypothetical protein BDB01DRAFT_724213 [Pilobolus umbonatus]
MPRHSKNNTASSVFTYHESHTLDYGTKRLRLGRDSYRNYDACFLCLQTAREPVCCSEGHLACKECIYESILQQKQAIQREQRSIEQSVQESNNKKQQEADVAEQKALETFDKTQNSMLGGRKRKLDEDKPKIASFWVPSLTPAADPSLLKPTKTQVICTAVEKTHPLSMKSLVEVHFEKEKKDKTKNICPACLKTLSNASKLSGKTISVIALNLFSFISNSITPMWACITCYVCEKKVKSKDIIDMTPEGTGFAQTSTKAVAERFNLAFQ